MNPVRCTCILVEMKPSWHPENCFKGEKVVLSSICIADINELIKNRKTSKQHKNIVANMCLIGYLQEYCENLCDSNL